MVSYLLGPQPQRELCVEKEGFVDSLVLIKHYILSQNVANGATTLQLTKILNLVVHYSKFWKEYGWLASKKFYFLVYK